MRIVLSLVFTFVASHVIAADIVLLPDGVWTADGDATHHGWAFACTRALSRRSVRSRRSTRRPTQRASISPARR
jgi:hypothetical protein